MVFESLILLLLRCGTGAAARLARPGTAAAPAHPPLVGSAEFNVVAVVAAEIKAIDLSFGLLAFAIATPAAAAAPKQRCRTCRAFVFIARG
uniref:Putative secreted protein n=1 Tax=Anopheles darlingi TaxID=43151 RepID=A0A2M4DG73_ANODA